MSLLSKLRICSHYRCGGGRRCYRQRRKLRSGNWKDIVSSLKATCADEFNSQTAESTTAHTAPFDYQCQFALSCAGGGYRQRKCILFDPSYTGFFGWDAVATRIKSRNLVEVWGMFYLAMPHRDSERLSIIELSCDVIQLGAKASHAACAARP